MPISKEKLHLRFLEEYNKLNEQQRLAVDTIEGPVMVIAGPGTGKTQILASRIGKILLETDSSPENILCLTYTDSGAVAMRKRLLQWIGADAYRVNIYTFHAFCNDIIQENLFLFEKTVLDPISALEEVQFFKELIDSFPKNHVLKRYRGDVYYEMGNLRSLFGTMKREGWKPKYIAEKVKEYLESLPDREEYRYKRKSGAFKVGDLKQDKVAAEHEKMSKLMAAVNEFDRFQELMRRKNRYDFADMINWVIDAFNTHKNLLANYQERFQYVLVDEYQDTSGTQNKLVHLLINYWEKPNVFVVGDDDQSIYRFQGANVENMLQFANQFKQDLLTVVLTQNYRSTQPILDAAKSLIDLNTERLVNQIKGLSKQLIAANAAIKDITIPPQILEYESARMEMVGITAQVEELIRKEVLPGRIAVIYKENKYGEELSQYFKLRNIPVYSKRNLDIFTLPVAKKIILLLKYIAAEHDIPFSGDEMLFEILHFDWFKIPAVEIARLSIEVADRRYGNNKTSIREMLTEKAKTPAKDLFSSGPHEGLLRASAIIESLIAAVPNVTLQQLFERIVREAGVLSGIMQSADKHWLLQILTGLFDFVKEETHRNPYLNLQQLVNLIELMEDEGIALPLIQISGSDKGVNLLTAHGSKGLEFEYVFFAGCNASSWEKKKKPGSGYSLPDTMFSSQPQHKDEEELRRLFYVALTRAEKHLSISYSKFNGDGKQMEPSMFIAEIQEQQHLPSQPVKVNDALLSEFASLVFTESMAPEIEKVEEALMSRLLDKFTMNVTALNNFLKCPLQFYFNNLIRIPSPKNENTEFGSAVHEALEMLFRKMQDGGKQQFPDKTEFIADFERYMHRHRESFTKEQFNRRMEYGQEVLSNYYDKYIHQFNKIVSVERAIRNVVVKDVPLKGKLDKLEFEGRQVNVVDYKTGDPDKAGEKLNAPNEKNPHGGDYWRQAVFYKLLVERSDRNDWEVISTEFDFIEPDKKKLYRKAKLVIGTEDLTTVTEQIRSTWERIQKRDFYTGCGKADCHWCEFVKTNNLAVTLHAPEQDDTDA
ncbi:MAG TPA: ATP-dependent DNA helicase [Agriterribacter sp.]|nr:ATP-dependent helicase [Chitinophagaceae bacterium]HRP33498.1 ATP-dependent DNA helicase [Agriterribacter sp.]